MYRKIAICTVLRISDQCSSHASTLNYNSEQSSTVHAFFINIFMQTMFLRRLHRFIVFNIGLVGFLDDGLKYKSWNRRVLKTNVLCFITSDIFCSGKETSILQVIFDARMCNQVYFSRFSFSLKFQKSPIFWILPKRKKWLNNKKKVALFSHEYKSTI